MLVYGSWLLQFAQDGGLGLETLNLTLTRQGKEEAGNCFMQWSANGSVVYMLGEYLQLSSFGSTRSDDSGQARNEIYGEIGGLLRCQITYIALQKDLSFFILASTRIPVAMRQLLGNVHSSSFKLS